MAGESNLTLTPTVSILLPVYNAAPYVAATIESLLMQTLRDFEVIAIDDGSTDASLDVLRGFKDARLRIVTNGTNLGLVKTLNLGINLCRSEFIARMDADDIAVPRRLEKQVAYLRSHSNVILISSSRSAIDHRSRPINEYNRAISGPALIRWKLLTGNFITHTAVMLRKSALPTPLFEEQFKHAEDYAAWLRLLAHGDFETLQEPLVAMRWHGASVSASNKAVQVRSAMSALARHVKEQYSTELSERSLSLWSAPEDSQNIEKGDDFLFLLRWMNPLRAPFRSFLSGCVLGRAFLHYHRRLIFLLMTHRRRPTVAFPVVIAIVTSLMPMARSRP